MKAHLFLILLLKNVCCSPAGRRCTADSSGSDCRKHITSSVSLFFYTLLLSVRHPSSLHRIYIFLYKNAVCCHCSFQQYWAISCNNSIKAVVARTASPLPVVNYAECALTGMRQKCCVMFATAVKYFTGLFRPMILYAGVTCYCICHCTAFFMAQAQVE